jgi:hypothetical protein
MFPLKKGGKEKRKEELLQIKTFATLNHPTSRRNFLFNFLKKGIGPWVHCTLPKKIQNKIVT